MADIASQIQAILNRGECIQLVGVPGMGTSRLVKSLDGLHLDHNLFTTHTASSLIDIISHHPERQLIIIDSLDRFLAIENIHLFFNYLKGLRDQHKYQLKYIFITQRPDPIPVSDQSLFGDLFALISENIIKIQPIPESEIPMRIQNHFSPNIEFNPTPDQLAEIARLSGGIPALIKIIMQAMRDNKSYDFSSNLRLKAQLEEMRQAMGDQPQDFGSEILKNYLSTHTTPILSAAETRLFNLFTNHKNQIVSKDQICNAVYPDVKNQAGISDHALDQLIHRLREKVKGQYSLTTHRGLGYQLSSL